MRNLRQSSWVAASLALAVLGSACDRDDTGSFTGPTDEPVYAAMDSTFASNPNRTFVQVERLGNPLVSEALIEKREHETHNVFPPFRDAAHFTDDIVGFVTGVARRDAAYGAVIASVLVGTTQNPGDMIAVFTGRAAGVSATMANDPANTSVGWLTHVLAPNVGYGGRKLRGDDVVDKALGVVFGAAAGNTMNAFQNRGLATDNVDNTNPAPLSTFPYFPGPNAATPPETNPAGRTIYGIDAANNLITFGALTPGTRISQVAVTGLANGETLVGIDFRPADDALYAVSSSSRLYTLNVSTGAASPVGGGAFTPVLSGTAFGVGFNPQADRLRIHTNNAQNLRVNQTVNPLAVITDTVLAYVTGDVNAAANPQIGGTAYTLSVRPAPTTTELFAIDFGVDALVRLNNPNAGTLTTVGNLGFDTSENVGFDIAGDNGFAYASLTPAGAATGPSRLYALNLQSGTATVVGQIGHPTPLRSIAVAPGATP